MEFDILLKSRRSIREFDANKKATKEQIIECVKAGIEAPSWKNSQTARYYCIFDEKLKEEFFRECLPEFNANSSKNATLVVTTFVANRSGFDRNGVADNECGNGWGYYDLGIHNNNFILKAKEIGLDTLIMGIRNGDKIRQILDIPDSEIVVSVIAVGYAAINPERPKRKDAYDIIKFY